MDRGSVRRRASPSVPLPTSSASKAPVGRRRINVGWEIASHAYAISLREAARRELPAAKILWRN